MDKQAIQERHEKILEMVREFCAKKLDQEYFGLTEKLIQKLSRKRNPPMVSGDIKIWSAAVVHAIGSINFLFDKSFDPFVTSAELNDFFGTKSSTVSAKSKLIRDLLKLGIFDSEFSTSKLASKSPMATMVMVDGFIVPLSNLPEQYQAEVLKARAQGRDLTFTTRQST